MKSYTALLVLGLLVAGAMNGMNGKFAFQTCVSSVESPSLLDESMQDHCPRGLRHFNKPWLLNWFMFWAEFSLLPIYAIRRILSQRRRRLKGKPPKPGSQVSPFVFILPAACDLLGSGFLCVGTLFVPAAVASMVRGSMVIFSALMSVLFLKKHLLVFHYLALLITTAGLGLVSYAAIRDAGEQAQGGTKQTLLGITIIMIGVLCNAFQMVFEEYLLSGAKASAQLVVGLEGMWGVMMNGILLVVLSFLPGSDNGVLEDSYDSAVMFSGENSSKVKLLMTLYIICTGTSQLCGMTITKKLSAVARCLISNCQVILVWMVTLSLYYCGSQEYGTPWTSNSWFQLAGFICMVFGTLTYNEVFRIPGLSYVKKDLESMPDPIVWSPRVTDAGGLPNWESPSASEAGSSPGGSPRSSLFQSPDALTNPLLDEDTIVCSIDLEYLQQ